MSEHYRDWKEIGSIPPLCEMNFLPYKSPIPSEFEDLYGCVYNLVKTYISRADISLFPYIIPEFYSNNLMGTEHLIELPLDDKHGILEMDDVSMLHVTEHQMDRSFFEYNYNQQNCEWHDDCMRIKWAWAIDTPEVGSDTKMKDYCKYKQVLSNAFFDAQK